MAARFTKLDRAAIRRLGPGERITERGIVAERLSNGDVRYSVNVMIDGQRVHRVVGRESDGTTRTQAEQFAAQARVKAREGRLGLPSGRKTHLGFTNAAKLYIERLKQEGGRNITRKRRHLELHLQPFFKAQRLDRISDFTVGQYKKRRRTNGAAPGTINRELATLSHFLRKAVSWKWITAKPCTIEKEPEGPGRLLALSDSQAAALLQAAGEDEDPLCGLFVAFGLNTAMRHSEILRARFELVDFEQLRLSIPKAKAGARVQPITQQLAELLKQEQEVRDDPRGWIFPTERPKASSTGHRHRMDKPFARAVRKAGLDPSKVTPHAMRHSAITRLVKAGVDLPTIQRISGHKTLSMVQRYTHVHGRHIDAAMDALGQTLPEPNENPSSDTVTQKLHTPAKKPA